MFEKKTRISKNCKSDQFGTLPKNDSDPNKLFSSYIILLQVDLDSTPASIKILKKNTTKSSRISSTSTIEVFEGGPRDHLFEPFLKKNTTKTPPHNSPLMKTSLRSLPQPTPPPPLFDHRVPRALRSCRVDLPGKLKRLPSNNIRNI